MHASLAKYFSSPEPYNGEIITTLLKDMCRDFSAQNVLFVRTPTTGAWLDQIELPSEITVTRLLYTTRAKKPNTFHRDTVVVEQEALQSALGNGRTFDLICVDPFHEYQTSFRDLSALSAVLAEDGCLLCHDCGPYTAKMAAPYFQKGAWCGTTYAAFVRLAFLNPEWYYTVMDTDTGIGVIRKRPTEYLKTGLDRGKQIQFNRLVDDQKFQDAFKFFRAHGEALIGLISTAKCDSPNLSGDLAPQ